MDIKQKKSKPLTEKQALTIMTKRKSCIQKYRNSLTKTAKKHVKFDKPLEEVHEIPAIGEPEPMKKPRAKKEPKVKEPKVKEPKVKAKEPKVKEPKVKEPKVKEPKVKAKEPKVKAKAKEPPSEEIEDL